MVLNNSITGNSYSGVHMYAAHGTVLSGNLLQDNGYRIRLYSTDDCEISVNDVLGTRRRVSLLNSNHNYIGKHSRPQHELRHSGVTCSTDSNSSYNYVFNNRCDGTTISICLDGCTWNIVQGNRGTGNTEGVPLWC